MICMFSLLISHHAFRIHQIHIELKQNTQQEPGHQKKQHQRQSTQAEEASARAGEEEAEAKAEAEEATEAEAEAQAEETKQAEAGRDTKIANCLGEVTIHA